MTEIDFDEWKRLLKSAASHDRAHAADIIPKGPRDEIVRMLIECLRDADALVRACAADSLGSLPTNEAVVALRNAAESEKDQLAKSYVYSSLGVIGSGQDVVRLATALDTEDSPQILVGAALGLLLCSQRIGIENLIKFVEAHDNLQSSAINALQDYFDNVKQYKIFASRVLQKELKADTLNDGNKVSVQHLLNDLE